MRTLDAHFGRASCPFTPPTYVVAEMRTSKTWGQLVASQHHWLLKTSAHRGQGLKLVQSTTLLAATDAHGSMTNEGTLAVPTKAEVDSLRSWLGAHPSCRST